MRLQYLIVTFLFVFSSSSSSFAFSGEAANAVLWSTKMADSEMKRSSNAYASWNYVNGTVFHAMEEIWQATGQQKYYDFIKKDVDRVVNSNGAISGFQKQEYNIDNICEGRVTLMLHRETGQSKYLKAVQTLYDQLLSQPRTSDGGFWHKQKYEKQMWLDGLYMGGPFYCEYSRAFNLKENYNDIFKQIALMEQHMRDSKTGLLYHGWDETKKMYWADPVTGCSKSFWGRAMGWYMMGVVDILDSIPSDFQQRDSIIHIFQRISTAIVNYQDQSSGCWYQVVDSAGRDGNYLEASASCMFVFALAKGVRKGYLDNSFLPVIERGYNGLITTFISSNSGNVNLNNVCSVSGLGDFFGQRRDGSFQYYISERKASNDGKGVGSFILAGLEVGKLGSLMVNKKDLIKPQLNDIQILVNKSSVLITFDAPYSQQLEYRLFDLSGNLLRIEHLTQETPSGHFTVRNSIFTKGVYVHAIYINGERIRATVTPSL